MKQLLLILLMAIILGSCLKEPDMVGYSVNLAVDFGTDFPKSNKAGAKVVLVNQQRSYTLEAVTDENGKVIFPFLEPGFYSLTVSFEFKSGTGTIRYSALKNITVFGNIAEVVTAKRGILSPLIIKEVYFSGSTTPAGKKYPNDQFLEIYNNSNEVQFADGISVLIHESSGVGIDMWQGISDTIVAETIWSIPGSGTEHPIRPGSGIIIARDGINHKIDPYGNPLSPVNLGNADFEFYVDKKNNTDTDSPRVPNMIEDYSGNEILKELVFDVRGGSAIAIARLPGTNEVERKEYIKKNLVAKLSSSGSSASYYPKVANKYILDAVETVQDDAHAAFKRFTAELDAGYIFNATGSYSGKSVRRKTESVVSGRIIYQDTNNSTNDFLKDLDPKPGIYE